MTSAIVPDEVLTVFCWLRGDETHHLFPVQISSNETVGVLKYAIKNVIHVDLAHVEAPYINLYAIPDLKETDEALAKWSPVGRTLLDARLKVSDLSDQLIIVVAPPILTLNCWVRGQATHRIFFVEISGAKTIQYLQEAIKSKKVELRDISADALALYRVSILYDEHGVKTLEDPTLDHGSVLSPLIEISDVFPEAPPDHVHVIVELPASARSYEQFFSPLPVHGLQSQRSLYLRHNVRMAPSTSPQFLTFDASQQKPLHIIDCSYPHTACATIPATLLHRTFAEFLDDCEGYEATADDISFADALRIAMLEFYPDEATRASTIRDIFSQWGLRINPTAIPEGSCVTDGEMSVNGHRYVIAEFKNEVGTEPYSQACQYYLESTRKHAPTKWFSPLPCMILLAFGPCITFAGAAWNTCPVIQPLSTSLQMHHHPTDPSTIARHLGAFKNATNKLEKYYQSPEFAATEPSELPPAEHQLFPFCTTFESRDGSLHRLRYERQPFDHNLVFFAACGDDDGGRRRRRSVCVKFVRRYSKHVHETCADRGRAPELLAFERLPGGWFMVVMERMVDMDCIRAGDTTLKPRLVDETRDALAEMHRDGLVHGDVRDANVMVSRDGETRFVLIDFDWAGRIGEVRYPRGLNRRDFWRPVDAMSGGLITARHDMQMLGRMASTYASPEK